MPTTPHLHLVDSTPTPEPTIKEKIRQLLASATPRQRTLKRGQGRQSRTAKHVNGYVSRRIRRRSGRR